MHEIVAQELQHRIQSVEEQISQFQLLIHEGSEEYYQQLVRIQKQLHEQAQKIELTRQKKVKEIQQINRKCEQLKIMEKQYESGLKSAQSKREKLQKQLQQENIKQINKCNIDAVSKPQIQKETKLNKQLHMKMNYLKQKIQQTNFKIEKENTSLLQLKTLKTKSTILNSQKKLKQKQKTSPYINSFFKQKDSNEVLASIDQFNI